MRKFFATLLALVMVLSLMVPTAWAAEEDVTVLYTNDIHTYIDGELGYSELAALKDSLGENVLLVCHGGVLRCHQHVAGGHGEGPRIGR